MHRLMAPLRSVRQTHHQQSPMTSRSSRSSIPRDVQEFLDRYKNDSRLKDQAQQPTHEAHSRYSKNWEFYSEAVVESGRGQEETRKCVPNNLTISELHAQYVVSLRIVLLTDPSSRFRWMGSYDILEREHGYIQWLFPIREQGIYVLSSSSGETLILPQE